MDRIWILLGLFAIFFALYYRRLRNEPDPGAAADRADSMLHEAERRSAIGSLVIASILILVSILQGSLLVLVCSLFLLAFGLWRLQRAREI